MGIHTLVISDVHLERPDCNAGLLLKTLQSPEYEEYEWLIIVGDLCQPKLPISDDGFALIAYLRENRSRIVYIDGNHDPASKLVRGILGIKVLKKYEWKMAGKKFCAMHGHRFDRYLFIFGDPLVDGIFSGFVWLLQKIDRKKRHVANWLERLHERYARHIAAKAKRYAIGRGKDVMICGHVHRVERCDFSDRKTGRKIAYLTCGWAESLCSLIAIDENGKIEVVRVEPP